MRLAGLTLIVLLITSIIVGCAPIFIRDIKSSEFLRNKVPGVALISPDQQSMVFTLRSRSGSLMYRAKIDGSDIASLSNGSSYDISPTFSSNGLKVIFVQIKDGQGDICIMRLDGTDRKCLTSGPQHDYDPVYSPKGDKIYFLRAQIFTNYSPIAMPAWHQADIYSIKSDGTELKRITYEDSYFMNDLSIDAKGDTLLVTDMSGRDNTSPLFMISMDGSMKKKVVQPDLTNYREKYFFLIPARIDYDKIRNPQISPDGKHMLFTWPYHDGLFLMNLQTSQTTKLWESKKVVLGRRYPRFSQDGRKVIFSTLENSNCINRWGFRQKDARFWVAITDGTGLRPVGFK